MKRSTRFQPAVLRLSPTDIEPDIGPLAAIWESSGDRYVEHHPDWAKSVAQADGLGLDAFTTVCDAGIDSYALVEEGRGALLWLLGEVTIHRKPIERLRVVGGQAFASDLGPEERRERARELLAWLSREARGRPVFLQSLPVDSPLWDIIHSTRSAFRVMSHDARKAHFSIDLPDSTEAFYSGLGYKTRKSIRYSVRKLEDEMAGEVVLKCFSRASEVDEFLDQAMTISNKTYQYRLLNMGIRNRRAARALFAKMADRGWWRGYILHCRDEPAAFVYGYQVGTTFYYWEVGYDPKWIRWSVGTVTAVKLIEDLITGHDRVLRLDFLYGDHDYKKRLSNAQCDEQSFYLFPRGRGSFLVFHSLRLTNRFSHHAGQLLERYKMKSRIKRVFRRRAIRG